MPEPRTTSDWAGFKWRERAEENPGTLLSRLWRWHAGRCPGMKAYRQELEAGQE